MLQYKEKLKMNKKKSLQELTFKDNFMFGMVMLNPENCKGIRLDAFAKDENNTHYDVEMETTTRKSRKSWLSS